MEQRYATSPEHVPGMGTTELRSRYLVPGLFADDQVNAVYTHHDRIVLVGVQPVTATVPLPTFPEIRSDTFFVPPSENSPSCPARMRLGDTPRVRRPHRSVKSRFGPEPDGD